jgi:transposase
MRLSVAAVLGGYRNYAQVARDFDLVPETVRTWVKRVKEEQLGKTPEARDAAARARVAELERRVKELGHENSFLKNAQPSSPRKASDQGHGLPAHPCGEGELLREHDVPARGLVA